MATIREIRQKIRSIGNIQKITQAMELVAASGLRTAQAKAEAMRPYAAKIKEILDRVISVTDQGMDHPLLVTRTIQKVGLIIIAGDRGLCGSYNQNIFRSAETFLANYQTEAIELFLVGRKAVAYFQKKPWTIISQLENGSGKRGYPEIESYTRTLMDRYIHKELDEIWLLYTHFTHVNQSELRIEKFLPIHITTEEASKSDIIFEPNASAIFRKILPRYCTIKMQSAFHNSYASELAARIVSMQTATKNAKKMVENLTLERNKLRQRAITTEIIEITAGAESVR